jgi:26S proteasome non-ATPase regulatory subunit 10
MNSARQPSILLLFGKGKGQGELLTDPIRVFCCLCCVGAVMNGCVLQPEWIVLYKAAKAGKLDEVEAAVDAGAPMEWANPDDGGKRAVHVASALGHKDVVSFLGSRGADVNAVDTYSQWTPLHHAAYAGKASVCTTLLALGADPAAKNEFGGTALDRARRQNKTECVAVLEAAMR